tara:strand:- start:6673 stop:7341 length:669 start_codon:yes stop_codon:yes gene_type:complete
MKITIFLILSLMFSNIVMAVNEPIINMGKIFSNIFIGVEEPEFNLISKEDSFEIRQYAPKILAQVSVTGNFNEASSEGFKALADFIFGNNISIQGDTKIDMTAPVEMVPKSDKIEMTAPIITEGKNNEWIVSFVMPKEYSLNTLPKPNNKNINIITLPIEKYAVIVFSGLVRASNYNEQVKLLFEFIKEKKLTTTGSVKIARYNPPWTLPFFRRNELMIKIN